MNEQIGHAYAHCKCRVTGTAAGGGPSAATDEFALPLAFIDLRDFTVSAISRAVLQSLGGSPSEMIGRPALDLSQPTDRGRAQSLLISMRDGGIDFFRARHTIESVNGPVVATHWARSITFQDRKVAMFEFAVGDEHVPSPIMAQFGREPAAMVVGTLDAAGTVTDISANTLMALGLVPRSFIGHPLPARSKDGAPATLASPDVLSRYEHSFSVHVHLTDAAGSPVPFCGVVTALAAQPAAHCFIFAPNSGSTALDHADHTAQLEQHLLRIAAELESSGVLRHGAPALDPERYSQISSLSPRQHEVLSHLLRGERVPTIAAALYLSQSTVRNHLTVIFNRFGVHSQPELLDLLSNSSGNDPPG